MRSRAPPELAPEQAAEAPEVEARRCEHLRDALREDSWVPPQVPAIYSPPIPAMGTPGIGTRFAEAGGEEGPKHSR